MERLDLIFNYVLNQSVQVTVLVILVACLTFVLRNRSAHVRYLLWLVVLAKCLVPPLMTVSVPQIKLPVVTASADMSFDDVTKTVILTGSPGEQTESITTQMPINEGSPGWRWSLVWLLGGIGYLCLTLIKAGSLAIKLRQQRGPLTPEHQQRVEHLAGELGRSKTPRLWRINGLSQPFVWGFPCGAIYVPADLWNRHSESHVRCSLAHELIHVMRWDALINTLQILAQTLFWFHPLVWWANRRLRYERERCCDEATIALLNTPTEVYGETIIETLAAAKQGLRLHSSLAIAGSLKGIEKRLKSIMKANKRFKHKPNWVTIGFVGIMALGLVPTGWHPVVLLADDTTQPVADSTPEHIQGLLYNLHIYEVDTDISGAYYQHPSVRVDVEFAKRLAELAKQNTKVSLIANPKIMAIDGKKASVEIVTEEFFTLPLDEEAEDPNNENLESINTGLWFSTTGNINRDGESITHSVSLNVSNAVPRKGVNQTGFPIVVKNGMETIVVAQWHEAIVFESMLFSDKTDKDIVFVLTTSLDKTYPKLIEPERK